VQGLDLLTLETGCEKKGGFDSQTTEDAGDGAGDYGYLARLVEDFSFGVVGAPAVTSAGMG